MLLKSKFLANILRGLVFFKFVGFCFIFTFAPIFALHFIYPLFNIAFFDNAASKNFYELRFNVLVSFVHHGFVVVCAVFILMVLADCGLCPRFVTICRFWPLHIEQRTWFSGQRWRHNLLCVYLRIGWFQTQSQKSEAVCPLVFVLHFDGNYPYLASGFRQCAFVVF